jgi:Flp pilus assembly protein TadG
VASITERLRSFSRRFRKDTSGSATIEAVLWLPLFVVFLMMVADVSLVFFSKASVQRIAQDGNRAFSTGRFTTNEQTQAFIQNAVSSVSKNANVTTTVSGGIIKSVVVMPVTDMARLGNFKFLRGYNIAVQSQFYVEY